MSLPPIDTLTLQDARDEVARLRAELEQQRTRAEGAEQELRESNRQREIEKRVLWSAWAWFDDHDDRKTSAEIHHELQQVVGEWHGRVVEDSGMAQCGAAGLAAKLAAARAHLAGVDVATLDKDELTSTHAVTNWWEMRKLLAAAREVLS